MQTLKRLEGVFSQSAGAVLLALGSGTMLANLADAGLVQPHDPIFGLRMQFLFWAVAVIELGIGVLCLLGGKPLTKLALVFWIALNFTVYQVFVLFDRHSAGLQGYLGSPARAFGIPPEAVEWILRFASLYLGFGSFVLLTWFWLAKRGYIKTACSNCGGHIEFHQSGLGRRIECPHCHARIVLERSAPASEPLKPKSASFTLIELLVVMGIIGVLAALLLPSLSQAKERARRTQCLSNERQICIGMKLHADDNRGLYPRSGGELPWDMLDGQTHNFPWMQQILQTVKNLKTYHCPDDRLSPYSYFNGARAAYLDAGSNAAALDSKKIRFPAAYVLSGDTLWTGSSTNDADKDDYVQNCVGGPTNGVPSKGWQIHNKGQNILFEDGHANWRNGYSPSDMTFRYDSMHGWP